MQCKHCLTQTHIEVSRCPVCGIIQNTALRDLSPAEKKVRLHARRIRLVAMIHLIGAGATLILMSCLPEKIPLLLLALINVIIAVGLSRYALWAYKGATVYYFFIGMVGVISIQKGGIYLLWVLVALTALYLVGNRTSKAIFDRDLPEPD